MSDYDLKYFDDYLPGATYDCGIFNVSEDEIVSLLSSSIGRTVMRATATNFLRIRPDSNG